MNEKCMEDLFKPINNYISSLQELKILKAAEDFREERIKNKERFKGILFHIVPLGKRDNVIALKSSNEVVEKTKEIPFSGPFSRYCYEGYFLTEYPGKRENDYSILWRNGSFELCMSIPIKKGEGEMEDSLHTFHLQERKVILSAKGVLGIYELYNIEPPFAAFYTFMGFQGMGLKKDMYSVKVGSENEDVLVKDTTPFDRNSYLTPPVMLKSTDPDSLEQALKPLFDKMWNALGMAQSINYNDQQEFIS